MSSKSNLPSVLFEGNSGSPRPQETLAPQRNFSISTADRIRAAAGPHAYMRRKRHIEDLSASLREALVVAVARAGGKGETALRALEGDARVAKALCELNHLIIAHNRFYPIEANLPLDPISRLQLDHGRPYKPLPAVTLRDVLSDVLAACGGSVHVGKIL